MATGSPISERIAPTEVADVSVVIDEVRALMKELGGFYAAQPSVSNAYIDVRMVPGNARKLAIVRKRFPGIRFKAESYVAELQHA
jgi:hypothetical protein